MKILNLRPAPAGTGTRTIARFDAEITPELRLYNLILRQFADGTRRTLPPKADGRHAATFTPSLGERLTAAASTELQGHAAYVYR